MRSVEIGVVAKGLKRWGLNKFLKNHRIWMNRKRGGNPSRENVIYSRMEMGINIAWKEQRLTD